MSRCRLIWWAGIPVALALGRFKEKNLATRHDAQFWEMPVAIASFLLLLLQNLLHQVNQLR